jgi:hypothetical protein
MSPDKKKIEKIYSQIDKLATKGKEYIYEYYKLIDDLISKGEYNYYEMTLFYKYNISIIDNSNIKDSRSKTWNEILFQTNSSVSKKVKKILDTKGVYQMGFDIYKDSDNQNLGTIVEIDQLSADSKYYLENKQFARLIGTRVTYLEVTYTGATSSVIVNATNTSLSEDSNLVNRYKLAVEYLLSNS